MKTAMLNTIGVNNITRLSQRNSTNRISMLNDDVFFGALTESVPRANVCSIRGDSNGCPDWNCSLDRKSGRLGVTGVIDQRASGARRRHTPAGFLHCCVIFVILT